MPKRCKGLTFEQHKVLGEYLQKVNYEMQLYSIYAVSRAYGKTHKVSKLAEKAEDALRSLRSELDNLVCKENPFLSDYAVTHVYYGMCSSNNPAVDEEAILEPFQNLVNL